MIYGHPRLTLDIDIVGRLGEHDAVRLALTWPAADFYVPPVEVVHEEGSRPEHDLLNIIHLESAMRADLYVAGTSELNRWDLERRVVRTVEGEIVQVAPIEAVILGKLRYFALGGSDRHLRDVARMLEVSEDLVDRTSPRQLDRSARSAARLARRPRVSRDGLTSSP
ncbi:MAG TPA: hypothetical protein VF981_01270 [Gemmatimonadaceae bacterium]